jgi:hypothetical protein
MVHSSKIEAKDLEMRKLTQIFLAVTQLNAMMPR